LVQERFETGIELNLFQVKRINNHRLMCRKALVFSRDLQRFEMTVEIWPRMRLPSEKPDDGEEVLVRIRDGVYPDRLKFMSAHYLAPCDTWEGADRGPRTEDILGWWPLPKAEGAHFVWTAVPFEDHLSVVMQEACNAFGKALFAKDADAVDKAEAMLSAIEKQWPEIEAKFFGRDVR
jgi:hypothetical protein